MTDRKSPTFDLFGFDTNKLSGILTEVNEKSRKLVQAFVEKQHQSSGIDQAEAASVGKSFQELTAKLMADPNQLFDSQMNYWQELRLTQLLLEQTHYHHHRSWWYHPQPCRVYPCPFCVPCPTSATQKEMR